LVVGNDEAHAHWAASPGARVGMRT
jgi:hypothetical protein